MIKTLDCEFDKVYSEILRLRENMNFIPPEEYYKQLPTKRMASGVIFTNENDEILLIKPNYRETWDLVF